MIDSSSSSSSSSSLFFFFFFLIFDRIDSGSSSETRKRETGRGTAEDEKSYGEEVRRNEEGKERKGKAEVERNEGTEEEEEEEESGGMGCFWSRHHDAEAPTLDVVESQRPELGLWFFFCVFLVSMVVELWRSFLLCCC